MALKRSTINLNDMLIKNSNNPISNISAQTFNNYFVSILNKIIDSIPKAKNSPSYPINLMPNKKLSRVISFSFSQCMPNTQ